ncbi:MAG: hypothetical protein HQM12_03800 [SAR324 cluster bacterium]|nr:hypothetical protein [SAR324 cluster bacterium]
MLNLNKTTRMESVGSTQNQKHQMITEDFVILVIHDKKDTQKSLAEVMKEGNFTVHVDTGDGAIGSCLMFTPHIIVFDWDISAKHCQETLDFIRNQPVATHISQIKFLILARIDAQQKEILEAIATDPNVSLIEYQPNTSYRSTLKKNILRLFLQAKKESSNKTRQPLSEEEAASMHRRTASINELLSLHKTFNNVVLRSFTDLIKRVSNGNAQQLFDIIVNSMEVLHRPFIVSFSGTSTSLEMVYGDQKYTEKLKDLLFLGADQANHADNQDTWFISDQDRRCFWGKKRQLFFVTESPDVFDELDFFTSVIQNYEIFLVQAERRRKQIALMETVKSMFDDLYSQMESFEWSESLENMKELVEKMFSLDVGEDTN